MSRIGRAPITVPAGVEVKLGENNHISVKGPKGTLERTLCPEIKVELNGSEINVTRPNDDKEMRSLHGLTRTLVNNMIIGVTEGYKKVLEISGVGFRAAKEGKKLTLNVGFSHPCTFDEGDGIEIEVPNANQVIISGIDKEKVGQFAADVRKQRPPEPYKGKGIRYADEVVRRKEGKTGAK